MRRLNHKTPAMLLVGAMAILGISVLAPAQSATASVQDTFYVSTTGSDTSGDGSASSPWATIDKARDYIQSTGLNDNMTGDIDVLVAAGDYYVDSTIKFDESDSGSNGFNIDYKNWGAVGSAHIIGGQQISGWTQYSGNIYKAYVGEGRTFETLFENGDRAWKARYPNLDPGNYTTSQAKYLSSDVGVDGSHTVLTYKAGDLDPTGWDLSGAQVYIWSGDSWDWFTDTVPIQSVDTTKRQITLTEPTRYPIYQSGYHKDGSRYYVQGMLSLLDQPGEFYMDSASGYLYYSARDGAIADQSIVAPTVQRVISLIGSSETSRVHNIEFDGLDVEVSDFTNWYRHAWIADNDSGENHEYPGYDRQMTLPQDRTGMIYLENTDHVGILNSRIRNSGFSAIYMLFYNQYDTVSGNEIEDVGHSGIYIEGRYPGEGDVAKNNLLTNNLIHDVGQLVGNGAGIYLMDSGSNEVSYSEFYNGPRYAVAFDAYRYIPEADLYSRNNVIKNLKIRNFMQDSGDGAPLYAFGVSKTGTSTPNTNYMSQITIDNANAHPSMTDAVPNGVYMDADTSGQSFTNIKVTNTQGTPFTSNGEWHTFNNVSWQTGFDESKMDYANIGVTADFPYAVAPSGVTATASATSTTVSWPAVKNASSYDVLRSASTGGPYTTLLCSDITTTSCIDSTGAAGTLYYYVVRARTGGGDQSPVSTEAGAAYGGFVADSFENGFGNWTANKGAQAASSSQAHSGSLSYLANADVDVITHNFPQPTNDSVSVWFYDDAARSSLVFARADNGAWDSSTNWRGIGVAASTSATKYSTRINGTIAATSVARTTGWHEFTWDYTSGSKVDMFIDGTLVASPTGVSNFTQISLGDWWADSKISNAYFDDVSVTPAAFTSDGFESGMSNWAASVGSLATSTTHAHTGSSSFVVSQDREVATHTFSSSQNKVVNLWFYDTMAPSTSQVFAKVDNAPWSSGTSWRGIGVSTATSSSKYVTRIDGTVAATSVGRSTGWHEFTFDYSSGTHVDLSIDGTLVGSPTGITSFNEISLGDWWTDSHVSNDYFDDVTIQ